MLTDIIGYLRIKRAFYQKIRKQYFFQTSLVLSRFNLRNKNMNTLVKYELL